MAEIFDLDTGNIKSIIRSSNAIKKKTRTCVTDFLTLYKDFMDKVDEMDCHLKTAENVADIFLDEENRDVLNEYHPLDEVQLAVCGYNNVGKTSFIHELLGLGDFLPANEGAVTARIVKFSYALPENACLIKYTSVSDSVEVGDPVSLSDLFTRSKTKKARTNELRKLIKEHLARPEEYDIDSADFAQWAKTFIEIRIPSLILELGLHIYDTPGFLGSDPSVLRDNLLRLVQSVHPTLVFLYDNAAVSDDSRKCYEKLKEALRSKLLGVDIFFLNTKSDPNVIRKNARNCDDDDDDDDDETLLEKARLYRYSLLLNVNEMKGDICDANTGKVPSLNECECFDIFSATTPDDPMEKLMKRQAINRIIHYAAKHDLQPTKVVIGIVHRAIDVFFDFVLITNRRSPDEWKQLRDEALQWGEHFFKRYRDSVDRIVTEANRLLPQRFQEKYEDIKERSLKDCETRGDQWNERLDSITPTRVSGHPFSFTAVRRFFQAFSRLNRVDRSDEQEFADMLVEREVIKPTLQQVISQESEHTKQAVNKIFTCYRNKNELLHAAHREVLIDIGNFSGIHDLSIGQTMIKTITQIMLSPWVLLCMVEASVIFLSSVPLHLSQRERASARSRDKFFRRKELILHYLAELQKTLPTAGDQMKKQMTGWIDDEQKKFRNKVNGYFKVVCRTLEDRHRAYKLARLFAPQFARIECRLEANLNLAAHDGSDPIIDQEAVLGTGGFFTVHPATWGSETELVAKKVRDPGAHKDLVYLEAHFHRTVTRLNIPHMLNLKYLYEENESLLYLLLPRYDTDLHSFLRTSINKMTAEKAIQIARDIAGVVAHMHAHDLVHRDIKVQNILVDKQEQVYLADFGTCQHGTENNTFIGSRPFVPDVTTSPSSIASSSSGSREHSYQGTAVDVYLLGMLMYACAPKDIYVPPSDNTAEQVHLLDRTKVPESYCQLIIRCLNKDTKKRPTAKEIANELDAMVKLCLVCQQAPRSVRFEPCGHKAVCAGCLGTIQQRSNQPQCIICRQVFISVREDNNADTFIATS